MQDMQKIKNKFSERVIQLEDSRHKMMSYLQHKVNEQDWHGVADAAMDLRDIESELDGIKFAMEII